MMIEKEKIKIGANYRFENGNRRVASIENGQVNWVYVDGIQRMGRNGGSERIKYFAKDAIEEYKESHSDIAGAAFRQFFTKPIFIVLNVVVFGIVFIVLFLNH